MAPSDAKSTIGLPFIELAEVNSTNSYAMEQLQANLAEHGTAFFARHQTAGRGQHGKNWLDEPGHTIALSVIMDTRFLLLGKAFQLSVMVAMACYDFFSGYAGDETSIKWPNDLYWRDRKAGGILIENLVRGSEWLGSVVGIGININQTGFAGNLKNPVSLKQITGRDFDSLQMAKQLCECLEQRYRLLHGNGFTAMWEEYNQHLFKKDATVKLKSGSAAFYATILGVSREGELQTSGASKDRFRFGEIEWVLE